MLINYKSEIKRLDGQIPEVTSLTVTYKNLTKQDLVECLSHFPNLESLEIADGNIGELPSEVFKYKNLIRLRLENTQISSIPDEIGGLKKLALLSITNTKLEYISDSLFDCPLEALELENVGLNEFLKGISRLNNLLYLKLNHNEIDEVSNEYIDAISDSLINLNLNDNQIVNFPLTSSFPNLQYLHLSKNNLSSWNDRFASFPEITELMIDNCQIQSVEFHNDMPMLNELNLSKNQIAEFPIGLKHISEVKYFHILENNFTNIPDEIEILESCEQLNFDLNKVTVAPPLAFELNPDYEEKIDLGKGNVIPLSIFQDKNMRILDLSGRNQPIFPDNIPPKCPIYSVKLNNCNLSSLPKNLDKLDNLFILELRNNHFTEIPKELENCKELDILDFTSNNLQSFAGYSAIKNLNSLDISDNPCVNNVEDLLAKRAINIDGFNWGNIKMHKKTFVSFMAALAKSPLSDQDKKELLLLAKEQKELKLQTDTTEQVIKAICIPHRKLENEIRKNFLDQQKDRLKSNPLSKDSILYLAGKPSQTKTEINTQCKELGIHLSKQLTSNITHILLGKTPKDLLGKALPDAIFISESELSVMHKAEKPAMFDKLDSESIDKIRELLRAEVFSNVAIAVEMLRNGGVPEALYLDILYVIKSHFANDETKALTKLIQPLLPLELEGVLKSRARLDYADERETDIYKKLVKNEKMWSIDFCLFMSLELFRSRKRGLRYLMTHTDLNHPLRLQAIELLLEDDMLNWQYAYGYQEDWWSEGERRRSLKIPFPTEILDKSEITKLNLRRCKIHQLPDGMEQFTSLKAIDLCTNGLKELPDWFENLQELEFLDLRDNYLKKFPSVLYKLPNLKKVLFGKQSIKKYSSMNDFIKPPIDITTAFPNVDFLFEDEEVRFYSSTKSSLENL